MTSSRPYLLNILLHPQTEEREHAATEALVRAWVEERKGTIVHHSRETRRPLAYPIRHARQATFLTISFSSPPLDLHDLLEKLSREKNVLRVRAYQEAPRAKDARTLKDAVISRAPDTGLPVSPKKAKASLEKLDEKIEEILEEKVL